MSNELKPCPFCGNTDVKTLPVDMNEANDFFILCEECGAQGPTNRQFVDETVAAWNRRDAAATPGAVAYEFHNPETGHAIVDYSEHTHAWHLTAEKGYIKKPLIYAVPGAASNPFEGWDKAVAYVNQRWPAQTPAAWICIYDDGEVDYTPLRELAEAAPKAIPLYRSAAAPGAECKSCAILRRYEKTARERGYAMGKAAGDNELAQVQELLAAERKAHAETNTALTAEITRLEAQLAASAPGPESQKPPTGGS